MTGYVLSRRAALAEQHWSASRERKSVIGMNGELGSRYDGTNFRTNMVTLAEYNDSGVANAAGVLGLSTAWACVRLVAGTISSLPLMVYRNGANGREVASDHPLYRVLHDSPNADQTALNFWQFVSAAIELQGNGYAEINRAGDSRVISLAVPFAPDLVSPRRLSSGAIEYKVSGRAQPIAQGNMLHIRGFGGNPLGGLSTLSFGRKTFGLAMGIESAAAGTFRNGVLPSGVLKTDKVLQGPQRKEAEALLIEKYQGAMRAGVPMLLDNGLSWESITINPDDAQMLESRSFSVEEICRFFSVPPHMIGHTEKASSWGTGIEQMTIGFVQFTLRERLKNIESTLEKQLLTPVERAAGMRIEFNIEGLLRGDSKTRSEVHASALMNGWRTINEVRAIENLPPVEGGDVPRMQMQNVPITEAGQQPAPGVTQ
jgi:HK97 family phage portal protein